MPAGSPFSGCWMKTVDALLQFEDVQDLQHSVDAVSLRELKDLWLELLAKLSNDDDGRLVASVLLVVLRAPALMSPDADTLLASFLERTLAAAATVSPEVNASSETAELPSDSCAVLFRYTDLLARFLESVPLGLTARTRDEISHQLSRSHPDRSLSLYSRLNLSLLSEDVGTLYHRVFHPTAHSQLPAVLTPQGALVRHLEVAIRGFDERSWYPRVRSLELLRFFFAPVGDRQLAVDARIVQCLRACTEGLLALMVTCPAASVRTGALEVFRELIRVVHSSLARLEILLGSAESCPFPVATAFLLSALKDDIAKGGFTLEKPEIVRRVVTIMGRLSTDVSSSVEAVHAAVNVLYMIRIRYPEVDVPEYEVANILKMCRAAYQQAVAGPDPSISGDAAIQVQFLALGIDRLMETFASRHAPDSFAKDHREQ